MSDGATGNCWDNLRDARQECADLHNQNAALRRHVQELQEALRVATDLLSATGKPKLSK